MKYQIIIQKYKSECFLLGILFLASFLFFYNLGKEGYSNTYYAASVKSMLTNPGIIIFNSFDPAGFVTLDKPPVSLWVQTLSAVLFGYSGFSLILPQAVAGLCSIVLLYYLVSDSWGKTAGLIGALSLTITPIFVAVVRTNNMDGLLVSVSLISIVLALKAWRYGSLWYLTGAAVLIGIGFNIKMIQAFAVIPACFGIYLLNSHISWRKKIRDIFIAGMILFIVSASWAVIMDLTPADQRPYIGSSEENSVLNLISGYNGLNRILGGFGGPGGMNHQMGNNSFTGPAPGGFLATPPGMNNGTPGDHLPFADNTSPDFTPGMSRGFSGNTPPFGFNNTPGSPPGINPGNNKARGPGMNDGGEPGLFRMGDEGMSGQISWMLPFVIIGLLAWLIRPSRQFLLNLKEKAVLTIALLLWLVPELVYFSFTIGFYHTYYVVMVAIPLAGLVGIGTIRMYELYLEPGIRGWLLILAILVTGVVQWQFMNYQAEFSGILPWIVLIGTITVAVILSVMRLQKIPVSPLTRDNIIILGIFLLCFAPFIWSCTPVFYQGNPGMPSAGPDINSGPNQFQGMIHRENEGNTSALYSYLASHASGEKYLVGVESSRSATDLIINYGTSVMTIGGFSGRDQILTTDSLKELIRSGEVRYFYLNQNSFGMPDKQNADATSWVVDSRPAVFDDEFKVNNQSFGPKSLLYDCKGVVWKMMTDYPEYKPVDPGFNPHYFRYFWGFTLIGVITTLTDISLLCILTEWAGIWYLSSAFLSYCTGAFLSYILNKRLNYKNQSSLYHIQGMMFLGISAFSMVLNQSIVYIGVTFVGISYLVAKIIATGIGFIFNYSGQTEVTFRKWR